MATESARHALYARLEEVLGDQHADTLMTHLPQHEATETATKGDIGDIRADLRRLEDRFDRLETTMRDQMKTYMLATVGAMTANTAIFGTMLAVFR